jgi:uncharacterized protein YjgD (DUF1641 family)
MSNDLVYIRLRNAPLPNLASEKVVEYLANIFPGFKLESVNICNKVKEKVGIIGLLSKLSDKLRNRL